MFDGITHVVQTEREDASVYPDQLHSYESRRLPLVMTLSVILDLVDARENATPSSPQAHEGPGEEADLNAVRRARIARFGAR